MVDGRTVVEVMGKLDILLSMKGLERATTCTCLCTWVSAIGEHLKCERETYSRDRYAVVVVGVVTGHIHM